MSDLSKILADLSPEQRELFLLRLGDFGTEAPADVIPRRRDAGPAPLSFAQERLWFLEQLDPGTAAFNVPAAVRLIGELDRASLAASLHGLVLRHEALRTAFVATGGEARQEVLEVSGPPLPAVDLRCLPPEERAARAEVLAAEETSRPFVLARPPLLRALLLVLGEREHVLVLTLHHLVADGWSRAVLFGDLVALYRAALRGLPADLPPLPVQYPDFAVWQRQWLTGERLESQLGYWRNRLAGAPGVLQLPTDRPRPAIQTHRGARSSVEIPQVTAARLRQAGQAQGATLFMSLLAVFSILLHRYTASDDLVVGSPVAGRRRTEVEGLIGLFVNTLAVRLDLGGEPDFRTLLGRVRTVALEALEHQDLPFEKLVEELQPERALSHSPLFQVMFILQSAPVAAVELPELTLSPLDFARGAALFDLTLSVTEVGGGLHAALDFNTDLFNTATAERLLAHFRNLLQAATDLPGERIGLLPMLSPAELSQALLGWNATAAPCPDEPVHGLIARQAARTPGAVAVTAGGEDLTYAELERRARGLAARLAAVGAGPGSLVGIALRRTPRLLAGLLGILKTGAAYVPLDPDYPQERLRFMIRQAGLRVLVSEPGVAGAFQQEASLLVDVEGGAGEAWDERPAGDLAYVIFTSGSTGRPKGVQVPHRALANFLVSMARQPGLGAGEALVAVTTLSFDIAALELFLPLTVGGRVVLVEREEAADGVALAARIAASGAAAMQATPATWRLLLEAGWKGDPSLTLLCGGEALPGDLAARLLPLGRALWNLYGPTETTVWSAVRRVGEVDRDFVVPIGFPIANTRLYVLDRNLQLVPVGVPGELYIGGEGVSRGYLARPDLTAERFVPDPFAEGSGSRLYRTGDLARRLPDGDLGFLGRTDHQVKVRGFRIELAEVEAALERHPGIAQAVVAARDTGRAPGDRRLVAYLVFSSGDPGQEGDLRAFLRERLPEHMIPSLFVPLESFPLTPSGKVDRKALPEPEMDTAPLQTSSAPLDPVQEVLAGIWSEVLGLRPAGVHQGFFELGGHSLLATQVVSRVREVFGVDLPLRTLFEEPTIAGLARRVEAARRQERGLVAPPLGPRPRPTEPPLSFSQQRLWFLDRLVPDNPLYNIHTAIRLAGRLEPAALEAALGEVVQRHESLRTTFAAPAGRPFQKVSAPFPLPLPKVDLEGLPASRQTEMVRLLALEESRLTFDLSRGPLLRAVLLRLDTGAHVLLLTLHHIVSDGWSMGVLVRELGSLYEAFASGRPSPLPELPLQYPDFALWQRGWLTGEVLESQLTYWKSQLAGVPTLQLPADLPRPQVNRYRGRTHLLAFPDLAAPLQALSRQRRSTLFMILLSALDILLLRYTGQEDLAVGTAIANRNRAETEPLIGFFVNTLVMRSDLRGDPPFAKLLDQVREVALEAYAHQDLPFEHLVEVLQPDRDMSRQPLFQVAFTLQNAPMPRLELPDLVMEPLELDSGTAKFDLFVSLTERDGALVGGVEYSTDLFEAGRICRFAGHLAALLAAVAADPDRRLSDLPLLSAAERHQLLAEAEAESFAEDCDLYELFAECSRRRPDAVAVSCEGAHITYRDLDGQARRLASRLRRLGVGPESLVGVLLERSTDLVTATLGVLAVGGAYVPLDPESPPERLSSMLDDLGQGGAQPVLVTSSSRLEALSGSACRVVCLDLDSEPEAASLRRPAILGEHPAYVIFTSGSTGRPKGVVVTHGNVVRLLRGTERWFGFGPDEVWTLFHSYAFDFSVWEMWGALLYGGRLVVVPRLVSRSPEAFYNLLAEEAVTVLNQTPSAFRQLMAVEASHGAARELALRWVVFGGEALDVRSLAPWFERHGDARPRLINMYGITETTVHVTYLPLDAATHSSAPEHSPIGRPLPDLRVHITDRHLQPVPLGVDGEALVGGAGLARGYLGRPDLTAERFVPDPFGGEPGARLYRSGDLMRRFRPGELEYLGRADHQVKVRGFRIEPGEIEAALRQHPAIGDAAVLAREDVPGDRRLVAYVVPAGPRGSGGASENERAGWRTELVANWEHVFDNTYGAPAPAADPTFDISGWNSGATGLPIPAEEMAEWVDDTVATLLGLRPRRVLEIGCGTGLLLFRVAPHCAHYRATDFSRVVLARLAEPVAERGLRQVELAERAADDFDGVEPGAFDVVILNSVVQYFPDADYLLRVLRSAVDAVADGGFVFVGDVRSLPLLETFHTEAELLQAPPGLTEPELRRRVLRRLNQEEELILDPAYFTGLAELLPRVSHVEVLPKRCRCENELTRFRYQVVLHVGPRRLATQALPWEDWVSGGWTLDALRRCLAGEGPEVLALSGIPKARLAPGGEEGVAPADLWDLERDPAYRVYVSWAHHDASGRFDAAFLRVPPSGADALPLVRFPVKQVRPEARGACANDPLQGKFVRRLVPQLRAFLQERIPDYMMPAAYVLLGALPLNINGKLDRGSLPAPEGLRPELEVSYEPPRGELESTISAAWQDVLQLDRVGRDDNFFDLGGNSLLLVQVHHRLQEAMGRQFPLMDLFTCPTVGSLAALLGTSAAEAISAAKVEDRARTRRDLMMRQRRTRPAALRSEG